MLKQRILTALILAPLVIAGIFYLPLAGFIAVMTLVTLVGCWEWSGFVHGKNNVLTTIILAMSLPLPALVAMAMAGQSLSLVELANHTVSQAVLVIGAIWWGIATALTLSYPRSAQAWQSSTVFKLVSGMLTLMPFLWSVSLLKMAQGSSAWLGAQLVLFVCLLVWAADSGAYFSGKSFGKHKMAPKVSPNKTIEGLFGGALLAMLVGWGAATWFQLPVNNWPVFLGVIAITVVISVLGDLVESMFKRVANIKDSGAILPGHGGILDRIDSLTAAFPIFALLYLGLMG
ncbi:Phosphatidate cytidylyltransferase [Vibrio stylophorae]|uniref:Phosphatidate cytidylyltransferase n=1 Tax=Vibrio stylophorae TaxID=659351 RepID=A0ABM8ZV70_9VIBR|nr:phosphatidate cytidylyltransferase [Vibrio stylophorae]CAH0534231.1 Phosphatidate cytidylyltransferase [Vibrio stylophorae]